MVKRVDCIFYDYLLNKPSSSVSQTSSYIGDRGG